MSERLVDEDQVRREQLAEVNVPVQWAYLAAIIIGGLLSMLVLIGLLGGPG